MNDSSVIDDDPLAGVRPDTRVRNRVQIPPAASSARNALQTTGHLPRVAQRYSMGDLLALIIYHEASDLHLRPGEPPLYRVDGRLLRVEGPPLDKRQTYDLIRAFTPDDVLRVVRDVGQSDHGFGYED